MAADNNYQEATETPPLVTDDALSYFNKGIQSDNVIVSSKKPSKRHFKSKAFSANGEEEEVVLSSAPIPPPIVSPDGTQWFYEISTIEQLFQSVAVVPEEERNFKKVKFVGANSSVGIYKRSQGYYPIYLFDTTQIKEMRNFDLKANHLTIGGGCTITMLLNTLLKIQKEKFPKPPEMSDPIRVDDDLKYTDDQVHFDNNEADKPLITKVTDYMQRVASTILRNIVSIAGNIAMEAIFGFASDLAMCLYLADSKLKVWSNGANGLQSQILTIPQFFDFTKANDNTLFLIQEIYIDINKLIDTSALNGSGGYKIAKRLELSHAIVNGGCVIETVNNAFQARVAFTLTKDVSPTDFGVSSKIIPFAEYKDTITFIESQVPPLSVEIIQNIYTTFVKENEKLHQSENDNPTLVQSKQLINQLFVKFLLQVYKKVQPSLPNAASISNTDLQDIFQIRRSQLSEGSQTFNVYKSVASEPIVKAEALIQSQGRAYYTWNNINLNKNCLSANYLLGNSGFKSFLVNFKKIEKEFEGVYVLTAETIIDALKDVNKSPFEDLVEPTDVEYIIGKSDVANPTFLVKYWDMKELPYVEKTQPIPGSRWIAKDYTLFAGQPIALLLSEDEVSLQNALDAIYHNYEDFVTFSPSSCTLLVPNSSDNNDDSSAETTYKSYNYPIVDFDEAIKENIQINQAGYVTKITTANICYKNPSIDWSSYHDVFTGTAQSGGQLHLYMEPQSCIAEPLDNGGVKLLCSTQSPISIQGSIASMLNLPSAKVNVEVIRLGGGFGGKTVQSYTTACAAAAASYIYKRQVRVALDRNTDLTITGGRHPYQGTYKAAFNFDTKIVEAIELSYNSRGGYSQDCTPVVTSVAVANSFNCYFTHKFYAYVNAFYTNTISNTAFRSFGVVQSQFLHETAYEQICDAYTLKHNANRLSSPEDYLEYQKSIYNNRYDIRLKNFFVDGKKLPYGTRGLEHVHMTKIWKADSFKASFDAWTAETIAFNAKSNTKKRGIGIMPMLYSISFNLVSLMQGEASISVKTDGSVILIVGCVDMGQGINTKLIQAAAQKLNLPSSYVSIPETTTNTPPNPEGTGASTGTDLNGGAVLAATKPLKQELKKWFHKYYNKINGIAPYTKPKSLWPNQQPGDWNPNTLFTEICQRPKKGTGFYYPNFMVKNDDTKRVGKIDRKIRNNNLSPEKKDLLLVERQTLMKSINTALMQRKKLWALLCSKLNNDRAQLLFSGHSNVPDVTGINAKTGRGDPDMYQNYAASICQVEVDTLTGEINFRKAHVIYDAGESLNPAIDMGQIEGAFIQGCGLMTSEEVDYSADGFNTTNTTWEYKPYFGKSIPQYFKVQMYPTSAKEVKEVNEVEYLNFRKQRANQYMGTNGGKVMSSKSTGEPPLVIGIALFQAIRDALRYYKDDLYFRGKLKEDNQVYTFADSPATVTKIAEQARNIRISAGVDPSGSGALF